MECAAGPTNCLTTARLNKCFGYLSFRLYSCNLCDAGYVGYTQGHLHERVDGHKRVKRKSSSICKHYSEHNSNVPPCLSEQFHVLTKSTNKFDCLIKEMLFIRKLKTYLNVKRIQFAQRYSLEELVILCYYVNL